MASNSSRSWRLPRLRRPLVMPALIPAVLSQASHVHTLAAGI